MGFTGFKKVFIAEREKLIVTNKLTPWIRVLLEKLIVAQLVTKCSTFV
jgi:hypothetical protein